MGGLRLPLGQSGRFESDRHSWLQVLLCFGRIGPDKKTVQIMIARSARRTPRCKFAERCNSVTRPSMALRGPRSAMPFLPIMRSGNDAQSYL